MDLIKNKTKQNTHTKKKACKDRLYANQFLLANQKICSRNGKYFAIMQSDANFVVVMSHAILY